MIKWLLPREERFFELLEQGATCALTTATLLVDCCNANTTAEREQIVTRMQDAEHMADGVIHGVYERLNRTFVTPIDRSDIYELATELENVVDAIYSTSLQIIVHAMTDLPSGSREIAQQILEACREIDNAVKLLRQLKRYDEIRIRCTNISALENAGDTVFRENIGKMFKSETDAIKLMKHKEFLEGLERTLDVCDDVANALEGIVIKNA